MAACSAGAAAGDAGDRVSRQYLAGPVREVRACVPPRSERRRLRRRPQRCDRVSLGGGAIFAAAGTGGRPGSPLGGPDRRDRRHNVGTGGEGRDPDDSDSLHWGPDPVGEGLVTSLNRPGGNVTGVALQTAELMPKRLQLLDELVPHAATIALLVNPIRSLELDVDARLLEAATRAAGRKMILLNASLESELEPAFASAVRQRADALLVSASAFFADRRAQLVTLAARHALPAAYPFREYADAGGLMSYGPSIADVYRLIGRYASRILKGDKPADLPVQLPTKFELILNLKTAKALGLDPPGTLLARADELIE